MNQLKWPVSLILRETFHTLPIPFSVNECGTLKARAGVQDYMKYWAYLVAKLVLAGVFLYGLSRSLAYLLPPPEPLFTPTGPDRHDLSNTFVLMLYYLVAMGVIWAVIWDQRYRCRTCLRRLRMPILTGDWTHILLGRPRTGYICPFGHGTLKVEEVQITGHQAPDWQPHEDMWKELVSLDDTKK